jgi:micrococcal nuclease
MMNPNKVLLFFFLLLLLFPSLASAKTFQGQVIKVFDGDTFLVRIQGREEHIRLREIDAPEVSTRKQVGQEPWGKKAREFAISRVKDKTVRLEVEERDKRDPYHRLLAYVFVGDGLVNQEMVQSGNAFFYPGRFRGEYSSQLESAEGLAREKGLGVWNRKNGLRERPWEFRNRTQREESIFSHGRHTQGRDHKSFSPPKFSVPPDKVVGNKRSMLYHLPGSAGASSVSPRNRVFFNSPEEAEKAGFRRAKEMRNAEWGMGNANAEWGMRNCKDPKASEILESPIAFLPVWVTYSLPSALC